MTIAKVRDGEVPFQSISIILLPGETRLIPGTLRFIQLRAATDADTILISFTGSSFYNLPPGEQLTGFESDGVWIQNRDVANNAITIVTGMGILNSTRVVIDSAGTLSVATVGTSAVSSVDLGARADVVATSNIGTFSLIALFKRLLGFVNSQGKRTRGQSASMTLTADTVVIAAPGAGLHHVIKSLVLYNTHATVQTEIAIKDGAVELFRVNVKAGSATDGGDATYLEFPDGLELSSNTALNAANITTGAETRVAAFGVTESD